MKIGLTQRVEIVGHRKERRDCLDQAWTELLLKNHFVPIPLPNRTKNVGELFDELQLSGVILTGGNDLSHLPEVAGAAPERDLFEKQVLEVCSEREIPVLGVCRGMQLMAYHYGAKLKLVEKHVQTLHSIQVCANSALPLSDRDEVNSYHRYGVIRDSIKSPLTTIAVSEDGFVEALEHSKLPQWGIMWHPERPPKNSADVEIINQLFREKSR